MASLPIGILDSGVGGLSILNKIHQRLPAENLMYFADSAWSPYGPRRAVEIQTRCRHIIDNMISHGIKAVVLACNTATAAAVENLRQEYQLPIIGMEPAIKPAAVQSQSGVIGVLATEGTLDSDKFIKLKNTIGSNAGREIEIITRSCHGLVELIEEIELREENIIQLLKEYIHPLLEKNVDTLVLGCTHYSLITDLISSVAGPDIMVMDTGYAVAERLASQLDVFGLSEIKPENGKKQTRGQILFFSSGESSQQERLIASYWGKKVRVSVFD